MDYSFLSNEKEIIFGRPRAMMSYIIVAMLFAANQLLRLRLDYQYRTIYPSVTQIIYEIEYDRGFSPASSDQSTNQRSSYTRVPYTL